MEADSACVRYSLSLFLSLSLSLSRVSLDGLAAFLCFSVCCHLPTCFRSKQPTPAAGMAPSRPVRVQLRKPPSVRMRRQYPFLASQWHAEKNAFEWATFLNVAHSEQAVRTPQLI